ncbi:MAG: sensor domain-containing diguanylate cyclase [Firmicutes bacterium]|nr:sensor domain-containing diguanylate cyclase [Bacillota bacterium]
MEPLHLDRLPLENLIDNLQAPIIITDERGDIRLINKEALHLYECKQRSDFTSNIYNLFSLEDEKKRFRSSLQFSIKLGELSNRFLAKHKTEQGNALDINLKWTYIKTPCPCLVFFAQDITNLKQVEKESLNKLRQLEAEIERRKKAEKNLKITHKKLLEQISLLKGQKKINEAMLRELVATNEVLERQTIEDSLTGIYNRRYFSQSLESEIIRARHLNEPIALLLIDLDYFKKINDTHGHLIGDAVLKIVATTIQDLAGPSNILCRYGGEEFGIISLGTNIEEAEKLAHKISDHLAQNPIAVDHQKVTVTVSIGVSSILPSRWKAPIEVILDNLLKTTDKALYKAKSAGRNTVEVYKRT